MGTEIKIKLKIYIKPKTVIGMYQISVMILMAL